MQNGDMPRHHVVLKPFHDAPSLHIRQMDIEEDEIRPIIMRQSQSRGAERSHQHLETFFVRDAKQEARETKSFSTIRMT